MSKTVISYINIIVTNLQILFKIFFFMKRIYETVCGHKYVYSYKSLVFKAAAYENMLNKSVCI
jgi:hypothetical protein